MPISHQIVCDCFSVYWPEKEEEQNQETFLTLCMGLENYRKINIYFQLHFLFFLLILYQNIILFYFFLTEE